MDSSDKSQEPDSNGNISSHRAMDNGLRPWTQEEMEAAEPVPMPEVPDDEEGAGDVTALRIVNVAITRDRIAVGLSDGGAVPLSFAAVPFLAAATHEQRNAWRVSDDGRAIRWEALGEKLDIGVILAHRR